MINANKILPFLFLGNIAAPQDEDFIKKEKIEFILDASGSTNEKEEIKNGIEYLRIQLRDEEDENILQFFEKTNQFIDKARNQSKGILVHW